MIGLWNLILLIFLDGRIELQSKLCSYCLQLAIAWYFEPFLIDGQFYKTLQYLGDILLRNSIVLYTIAMINVTCLVFGISCYFGTDCTFW